MNQTIHQIIKQQSERSPSATAILASGRPALDYHSLNHHIESIVERISATGIGRGDHVAIVLPNGPEMATAITHSICTT